MHTVLENNVKPNPAYFHLNIQRVYSKEIIIGLKGYMKTCEEILCLFDEYLNGTMDKGISVELENHIVACTDCASFLNTYKTAVTLIKDLKSEEFPSAISSKTCQL
jgi:hypothetical protein